MYGVLYCALLTTCGLLPDDTCLTDTVDLIEINHFYDEQGRKIFDQLIFYKWCPQTAYHYIVDWRLMRSATMRPHYCYHSRTWSLTWLDSGVLRRVISRTAYDTWTQFDPELEQRNALAKDSRQGLQQVRKTNPPQNNVIVTPIE